MPKFPPRTIEQHIQEGPGVPVMDAVERARCIPIEAAKLGASAREDYRDGSADLTFEEDALLDAAAEQIREAEQAARQDERERCCKAICPQCADGRPLDDKGNHLAKEGGTILLPVGPCTAWSIRALAEEVT